MRDNSGDSTDSRNLTSVTSMRHSTTFNDTASQTSASTSTIMSAISARIPKRLARFVLVMCLLVTIAYVYITLFRHPPPDQLLRMNSRGAKDFNSGIFGDTRKFHASKSGALRDSKKEEVNDSNDAEEETRNILDMLDDEEGGEDQETEREEEKEESVDDEDRGGEVLKAPAMERNPGDMKGKAVWDKFNAVNHHTVIGIVFDKCDDPNEQLGTVVLLPDKENGGVMSRTFYNFTLDRVIDEEGWTFNIDVKYNGQDLYDNWWEVCEMEDSKEDKDRTFACPIQPGRLSLIKDKHIPGYIPKGRYQTKAWVKDSNNTILLCGYSDFVL